MRKALQIVSDIPVSALDFKRSPGTSRHEESLLESQVILFLEHRRSTPISVLFLYQTEGTGGEGMEFNIESLEKHEL